MRQRHTIALWAGLGDRTAAGDAVGARAQDAGVDADADLAGVADETDVEATQSLFRDYSRQAARITDSDLDCSQAVCRIAVAGAPDRARARATGLCRAEPGIQRNRA